MTLGGVGKRISEHHHTTGDLDFYGNGLADRLCGYADFLRRDGTAR